MKSSQPSKPSRDPSPDRPIAQPPRQRAACESCHSSKVRCTGGNPCARCSASRTECIYKLVSRIGKPRGSKNKSTLRREAEQAARDAEKARVASAHGSANTNSIPTSMFTQGTHDPAAVAQSWDYMISSRNWPGDSDVPGGSFSDISDRVSVAPNWVYGNSTMGTVGCQPSTMITAPISNAFIQSGGGTLFDDSQLRLNSSAAMQSQRGSLASDSSYTSSPWSGSAVALSNPSEDGLFSQDIFTIPPTHDFPAHTSCHCGENLASQLCGFRRPEALNSTTHNAEGFLTNTDHLLFAINSFLNCQTCEKNSIALSLMTTMFATFGQLFAALTDASVPASPSSTSPHITASLNLGRQLSFGGYQSTNESERSVRTMLVGQTVHKWREGCFKARRLLAHLQTRAQDTNYSMEGADYGMELASGGEGTPLWGLTEIESFTRVINRVDSELAAVI